MQKLLWIVLVACLMLVGCGEDQDKDDAGSSGETAALIAPEKAGDYLLTLADMPSGWSQEAIAEDEDGDDEDTNTFCLEEDPNPDIKATGKAEARFSAGTFGPMIYNLAGVYSNQDDIQQRFAIMRDALQNCTTWTDTDDAGEETTYTLSPMSFEQYGDETIALRMGLDGGQADIVAIRQGNLLITVMLISISIGGPVDDELLLQIVEKAAGKLE